ncbi:MAG TPA: serine hydrolase [Acidobacteriaceae bacterium]|nr:serine hydrolase [Acidobacteriaceae bacterium]
MKRRRGCLAGLVAMILVGVGSAWTQQSGDDGLNSALGDLIKAHHGKVAVYARQLNTSREIAIDADEPVQTASVIKLAILYNAMVDVREGKASWDEKLTLKPGEAVDGSGMLHFFDTPLTVTLKDVLTMMVIVSDNTATNLAIDRFGVDAVNARVESLGLKNTHLYKKVMKPATGPLPADYAKFGLGKTTAREMAELLEQIGECHLRRTDASASGQTTGLANWAPMDDKDKAVCDVALTMLKDQFYRETIPRYLPNGGDQTVASKTGSLNAVRNDVALVAGKSGPMVISIFTWDNEDHSWTVDNSAEMLIAKLAKTIVDAWSPDGLDAKGMVPGLGLPEGH